jgi:integrase
MILLAFRHGLRASEVCDLRWDQVDFNGAVLHVRRVKNGTPSTHPMLGDELRALRRLQRESPTSPFVFVSSGETKAAVLTAGMPRRGARPITSDRHNLGATIWDCCLGQTVQWWGEKFDGGWVPVSPQS